MFLELGGQRTRNVNLDPVETQSRGYSSRCALVSLIATT
jgi:hypothetical protein